MGCVFFWEGKKWEMYDPLPQCWPSREIRLSLGTSTRQPFVLKAADFHVLDCQLPINTCNFFSCIIIIFLKGDEQCGAKILTPNSKVHLRGYYCWTKTLGAIATYYAYTVSTFYLW